MVSATLRADHVGMPSWSEHTEHLPTERRRWPRGHTLGVAYLVATLPTVDVPAKVAHTAEDSATVKESRQLPPDVAE